MYTQTILNRWSMIAVIILRLSSIVALLGPLPMTAPARVAAASAPVVAVAPDEPGELAEIGVPREERRAPGTRAPLTLQDGVADWMADSNQAGAYLAHVSTAGDVNGDGYADVIVGAYNYDNGETNEGAVFIFYGSASGLSASPDRILEGNQDDAWFGYWVSTAGDVNGDGYADVIIGAPGPGDNVAYVGRAFVFYGSAAGIGATADWTVELAGAKFGAAVSTAGDVNGDGYSDVMVGAPYYGNGETEEGSVYVYYGSASGLSTTADWTAESDQNGAQYGGFLDTAGDVNGDGYADVIVGAYLYDYDGQTDAGRVFVYYGSASGPSLTANWTADSHQGGANLGVSAHAAGDVNGDGYADVIVGARFYDNGQENEGGAFAYYGSASGLSASPDWSVESNQVEANLGSSTNMAGDVNGDGYADVVVGAYRYTNGETEEGAAFVYYGSPAGLDTTADWTGESNQAYTEYGVRVGTAGDVNGDGFSDVIIGAQRYDNGETDEGAAFVYHGGPDALSVTPALTLAAENAGDRFGMGVSTAGDINGDGYADFLVGAPAYPSWGSQGRSYLYLGSANGPDSTPARIFTGENSGDGMAAVSAAGDVNGDGYDDVIIGAAGHYPPSPIPGEAYVYLGGVSGLSAAPALTLTGENAGDYFGGGTEAGDINGDGYGDVMIGASGYLSGTGRVYIYLGSADGLSATPALTLTGESINNHFGGSTIDTAGDVNGDGYSDIVIGAYGYNGNQGRAYIYWGGACGLSATPALMLTGENPGDYFSLATATAGDVNGDGYSDVMIGAFAYGGGHGRTYLYLGSASGLSATPVLTLTGENDIDGFGSAIANGDVNNDGYTDAIIGAYQYPNGGHIGRVYVYLGGATGLSSMPALTLTGEIGDGRFGESIASAGDVNGDGYSDILIGEEANAGTGHAYLYYGNFAGLSLTPRQLRTDSVTPIAHLGQSDSPSAFVLALNARTPFGRGKVKLEWQVAPFGTPFTATTGVLSGVSAAWTDVLTGNVVLTQTVACLQPNTLYHWRVRLRYHPATTPFQQYSRWVTQPWNGAQEADLRTGNDTAATWIQQFPTGTAPTPRHTVSGGYDEAQDRLIIFGGDVNTPTHSHLNDVWVLTNASGVGSTPAWEQLPPVGEPSSSRILSSAVYDPVSNRLIIHGGCTWHCGTVLDDAWALTNANGLGGTPTWISLPSAPIARADHLAAYDSANNRMIVFGGGVDGGYSQANDVWVLVDANGIGSPTWVQLSPVGPPPVGRVATAGVYDAASNRLIIFGGSDGSLLFFNDVWILSNANGLGGTPQWTQLLPSGSTPLARRRHSVFYDSAANRLIVFGGETAAGLSNDVWMLTNANGLTGSSEWGRLNPLGNVPPARFVHMAGYAPSSRRMIVTMGSTTTDALNDVWTLTSASGSTSPSVCFSANAYRVSESAGSATITVTLSAAALHTVMVDYATINGTASAGSDYTAVSGTLAFLPATTAATFTVPIVNDTLDEPDETLTLTLSTPVSATLGVPNQAVLTIGDDDNAPLPTVQFSGGGIGLAYNVTYDSGREDWSADVAVDTAGNMHVLGRSHNGTNTDFHTIKYDSAGHLVWNVTYDSGGDDEPVKVAIDTGGNIYVAGSSSVEPAGLRLVKYNSAGVQQWAASDASGAWGSMISGAVPDEEGNVYVATSEPWSYRHLIKYDSAGNVVWSKTDTTSECNRSGGIARDTEGNLYVTGYNCDTFRTTKYDSEGNVVWDQIYDPAVFDYSLDVAVDSTGNIFVAGFSGDNASYHESVLLKYDNAGNLLWDRRYDAGQYSHAYGGVAVDGLGNVYMGVSKIRFDWSPIDVHIVKYDSAWTLREVIVYDSGADDGVGGIAVDGTGDTLYVAGHSSNGADFDFRTLKYHRSVFSIEENAGTAVITATLSVVVPYTVTVNYTTSDGTALVGSDYSTAAGVLTFAPGVTVTTFDVPINDDTRDEPDETLTLTLSHPVSATLGTPSQAMLTIVDDDPAPTVDFSSAAYYVDEGAGYAAITVTLDAASALTATVSYTTTDGTAAADEDYIAASGVLTFAPGQVSRPFTITVNDDTLDENDETVLLALSNASHAVIGGHNPATLTLRDNDGQPSVYFSSAGYARGEAQGAALVTVTLSNLSVATVTVGYATSDGTATAGPARDYAAALGTLTFAPGQGSRTFTVTLNDDTLDENDETLHLTLSHPMNATLGTPNPATLTILDNDPPPAVQFSRAAYSVGEAVGSGMVAVTLSATSALSVTVQYATNDGTAVAPGDYTAVSGLLTFPAGNTSQSFTIPIANDTLDENNETVTLTLSAPTNATLGAPSTAVLTLVDDDAPPAVRFSAATYSVNEAAGAAPVTATLSAASGLSVTVQYTASDGTAIAPDDYTAVSGLLTFPAGSTTQSFTVPIADDTLDESDETVNLTLSAPPGTMLGTLGAAVLIIVDDDPPPAPSTVTLTITITGNGAVTLDPPGGVYTAGTRVRLTAVPAPDWRFGAWSGDLTGDTNPATLTLHSSMGVSATFELATYHLYLPLVLRAPGPQALLGPFPQIPGRPVQVQGETFYTTTLSWSGTLPAGGSFYFSGAPDRLLPALVDDQLALVRHGDIFTHTFHRACEPPTAEIVAVPRAVVEAIATGGVVLEYRDTCGMQVAASMVWLIWTP